MRFVTLVAFACIAVAVSASNYTLDSTPDWRQCDSRWGQNHLGTCSATICSAGCAITSVSMFIASHGYGGNPGKLNSWLKSNGGYASGCDIIWAKVDNLGFSKFIGFEHPSHSDVCSAVEKKHGIIANVNNGHHYVLITGCSGSNEYKVHDPAGRQTTFKHSEVKTFVVYHHK